jgi:hypothetical protein
MSTAPTTPLPRLSTGLPPVPAAKSRSTAAALLIWVLAVAGIVGGGGYFAYKKGLIFHRVMTDTVATGGDSTRLAAADSLHAGDSTLARDSARGLSLPGGTSGRLVLSGTIPQGARVTMDGQLVRGTDLELAPGTHKVAVRASGYVPYEKQVLITPGATNTLAIQLQKTPVISGSAGTTVSTNNVDAGYCDRYGPNYNQDNVCFDEKPVSLTSTYIPIAADATETPRAAILLIQVSSDGLTLEVREFVGSNVATFTNQAIDMAKTLRWQPAKKNGEPVEAWVQYQFLPRRQ